MSVKELNERNSKILTDLFNRTYENCLYYRKNGKYYSLANEIGVLRGIAYCLFEIAGICPHNDEFMKMIEIQQWLKEKDGD